MPYICIMELSHYAITDDNRFIYVHKPIKNIISKEYTVWGIGEHGFLHGAGSFLKKESIDRFVFDSPSYEEIERYYYLINKFYE